MTVYYLYVEKAKHDCSTTNSNILHALCMYTDFLDKQTILYLIFQFAINRLLLESV